MTNFVTLSGSFIQVEFDNSHYYCLGNTGLVVITKDNYKEVAYANISNCTAIWTNSSSDFLYLTTSGNGLKRIAKKYKYESENLTGYIASHYEYPYIHSNNLLSIDGLSDSYIALGSTSGVELLISGNKYRSLSYGNISQISLSSEGSLYYAINTGLACKRAPILSDWSIPTYIANVNSSPPIINSSITDIDILHQPTGNIVAVATSSGITIIRESIGYIGGSSILNFKAA